MYFLKKNESKVGENYAYIRNKSEEGFNDRMALVHKTLSGHEE